MKAIRASGNYLVRRLDPETIVVVSNFSASTEGLSDYVIEGLSDFLVNNGRVKVAARRELESLQREMDFQLSGEVSDETQQAIGYKLGAQTVISGSLVAVGAAYLMRVKAVQVQSAFTQASGSYTIRRDERLSAILAAPSEKPKPQAPPSDFRLALGARVGVSPRYYTLSHELNGGAATAGTSFEGGVLLAARFLSFEALGLPVSIAGATELVFTHDTVSYTGLDNEGEYQASFEYLSLSMPLLAVIDVDIGGVSVAALTGPSLTFPLGQARYEADGRASSSYDCWVPAGWTVGAQVGLSLGAGKLFADIRYVWDWGNTSISGAPGTLQVFSRALLSFSMGYKFLIRG